ANALSKTVAKRGRQTAWAATASSVRAFDTGSSGSVDRTAAAIGDTSAVGASDVWATIVISFIGHCGTGTYSVGSGTVDVRVCFTEPTMPTTVSHSRPARRS